MNKIADIAMGIIIVAGIMVMVRPNSQGPKLVSASTSGFASILGTATGGSAAWA